MIILTDVAGQTLSFKTLQFPGGELHVRLESAACYFNAEVIIDAGLESPTDILELILLTDALRRAKPEAQIQLVCPYLPYARQDRVANYGESLSVKVMADILNGLNFSSVEVWDVHSDVSLALVDRVTNIKQAYFVGKVLRQPALKGTSPILVAPDAGAIKKTLATAQYFGLDMVRADKIRDTKTGTITGTVVYSNPVGDKDFLIVDDICDGGRTFIELAKELRPLTTGKIYLYVTHGIFSKGLEVLTGIDHIFTANLFRKYVPADYDKSKLTVLEKQ